MSSSIEDDKEIPNENFYKKSISMDPILYLIQK